MTQTQLEQLIKDQKKNKKLIYELGDFVRQLIEGSDDIETAEKLIKKAEKVSGRKINDE